MFPSAPCLLEVLSQPFKRSQQGLFHGKMRLSGNNVPFSLKKTRRTWMPNIQQKRLRSETLDQEFKLKVTTRALKTIKKNGGLDNYVKNTRHELLGDEGMRLRLLIKDAAEQKKQERKHVGLHEALSSQKQLDLQSAEDIRKAVGEALGLPGLARCVVFLLCTLCSP
ncbi:hypothetical protein BDQ17DRAFT_1232897 [Cyathus striatus]|nr:hypothetical protein BDQ17DRAFT_1232897 [Cyathus striatus]